VNATYVAQFIKQSAYLAITYFSLNWILF